MNMNETNKLSFHFNLILIVYYIFFFFFEVQLVPTDNYDLSRIK